MSNRREGSEPVRPEELLARTGRDWARAIRELAEPIRTRVACLVWWDYFSQRSDRETGSWHQLDCYLGRRVRAVDDAAIAAGLVAVGYPTERAAKRLASTTDYRNIRRMQPRREWCVRGRR